MNPHHTTHRHKGGTSAPVSAAWTGSPALTIWPKETAPAPRASTEAPWAAALKTPMGASVFHWSRVRPGGWWVVGGCVLGGRGVLGVGR